MIIMIHCAYFDKLRNTSFFEVKEVAEAQELTRNEEDVGAAVVPVESESYVNLRKRMVGKHSAKVDNVLQENGKLCREFAKKQVGEGRWPTAAVAEHVSVMTSDPSLLLFFATVFVQSSRRFKSMLEQRRNLPAWQERENILDLLDQCQVLVVSGMTG